MNYPQYPPPQGYGPPPPQGYGPPPPPQKKSGSKAWIIVLVVVLAVVLVIGLGVVGLLFVIGSSSDSSSSSAPGSGRDNHVTDDDGDPVPQKMVGHWTGEMTQTNSDLSSDTWTFDLDVSSGTSTASISGINQGDGECTLDLTSINATQNQLTFDYSSSDSECMPSGSATIDNFSAGTASMELTSSSSQGSGDASGVLTKE